MSRAPRRRPLPASPSPDPAPAERLPQAVPPDRAAQAYALHQDGMPDDQIAAQLGYASGRDARAAYKQHWRSIGSPDWMKSRADNRRRDEHDLVTGGVVGALARETREPALGDDTIISDADDTLIGGSGDGSDDTSAGDDE